MIIVYALKCLVKTHLHQSFRIKHKNGKISHYPNANTYVSTNNTTIQAKINKKNCEQVTITKLISLHYLSMNKPYAPYYWLTQGFITHATDINAHYPLHLVTLVVRSITLDLSRRLFSLPMVNTSNNI